MLEYISYYKCSLRYIDTMKNTKEIESMREAIKEQDLEVDYYIQLAESIARELKKEAYSSRDYIYEKIDKLNELKGF